jgi:hypothetical protein
MSLETPAKDDEKPLDPAVEAVRRRLARLMVVSIGIMMVGVLAVLGAVVYKIRPSANDQMANGVLTLPAGAEVIDHSTGEGTLAMRVRMPDGSQNMLFFSTEDGRRLSTWQIVNMP